VRKHGPSHYDARRFFEKIFRFRLIDQVTGCWLWVGARHRGYGIVQFCHRRKGSQVKLHRLIAWLYLNYDGSRVVEVCHRCNVKACFNPAHLYLASHTQNMRDAERDGLIIRPYGEKHSSARLTEGQVREIRRLASSGVSHRTLAKQFGVNTGTISNIVARQTWKHLKDEVVQ
jgi:hypothetical protein